MALSKGEMISDMDSVRRFITLPFLGTPQVRPFVNIQYVFDSLTYQINKTGSKKDKENPTKHSHNKLLFTKVWIIMLISK